MKSSLDFRSFSLYENHQINWQQERFASARSQRLAIVFALVLELLLVLMNRRVNIIASKCAHIITPEITCLFFSSCVHLTNAINSS